MSERSWSKKESSSLADHLVAAHRQYGKFEPFWFAIASSFRGRRSAAEIKAHYESQLKQEVEERLADANGRATEPEKAIYSEPIQLGQGKSADSGSELPYREFYSIDVTEPFLGDRWIPLLVSRDTSVGWFKPPQTLIDDLPRGDNVTGIYELGFMASEGGQERMIIVYLGSSENLRSTLSSIRRSGGPLHALLKPFLDLNVVLHARWKAFDGDNAASEAQRMKHEIEQNVDYAFNSSSSDCSRRWPYWKSDILYLNHLLARIPEEVSEVTSKLTNNLTSQQLDDLIALLSHQRLDSARLLDVEK